LAIHRFRPRRRGAGPPAALVLLAALVVLAIAAFVGTQGAQPPAPEAAVRLSTVTHIVDGDTVDVRLDGEIVRVRLAEIDAPESNQAWGRRSEEVLARLTLNKPVRIERRGKDRYGRIIGRLYVGDVDVSARMIEEGCAWAYRKYLTDPAIQALENEARSRRTGLWAQSASDIVAPWEWRQTDDGATPAALGFVDAGPMEGSAPPAFSCGSARTCSQMGSCEEATFHLRQCGLSRLDRDGDGTPCESLCRPGGG
jgi:endonuclease YncB( thermonuclease family)